jgi:KipI family sensor histidine kinase inhibitor
MDEFRVVAAGDSALLVHLHARLDPATSGRVLALARAIEIRHGSVVRDLVVGYCSLTVYFDPRAVDAEWLGDAVRAAAEEIGDAVEVEGALVDVPVCYGGELGPDLPDVARAAGCSAAQVVVLHTGRVYRVYLVGFIPGFPYMAAVDSRIALPRRASPRQTVPAGSVAIAAGQTGIYPAETPGGWHLIGRTPIRPYDPSRAQPFLFRPGDRVRFHAISPEEYHQWPR